MSLFLFLIIGVFIGDLFIYLRIISDRF